MIAATVIGPIWATKRLENLPAGALLELEEQGTGRRLVALDQLGSGPGDVVLVTLGAGVAGHFIGRAPIDALVVGVVDESTALRGRPDTDLPQTKQLKGNSQ